MTRNHSFFELPQAAAVYKHRILRGYVPVFAGKTGSRSQGNRVVIYDAYSGPGQYLNGQPGSPQLVVDTAIAMSNLRDIYSVFSDKDTGHVDDLRALLSANGVEASTYHVLPGPVEQHLDDVLEIASDLPLFVFLDPYGFTIPFERVCRLLTARDKPHYSRHLQPKTELLMNFSYEAVRRNAGALVSEKDYPAKAGQIVALNNAVGGDWWQDLVRSDTDDWPGQVLQGFANRVKERTGYGYAWAAVRDSLNALPVYQLILFTRHEDGLWAMLQAMSYARREWYQWLKERGEKARAGQLQLDVEVPMSFDEDEGAWSAEIARNARAILDRQSGFRVMDVARELFGNTIGLAREMHLRKALWILKHDGVIQDVPKGRLQRAYIERA